MATSIQIRGDKAQLRVTHKLLPKAFFHTFDTEPEAATYRDQLMALLSRGIVPAELLVPTANANDPLLIEVIRDYTKTAPITDSDDALLGQMLAELAMVRISGLTYQWVDKYVLDLKIKRNLAPGSIRKRVGVLARVVDWQLRRTAPPGTTPRANPLRLLPRGYSTYSRIDTTLLDATKGHRAKRDIARDLRLPAETEAIVIRALDGEKRGDRERALQVDPAFKLMFRVIINTGMRLREAYRLRVDQVDLARNVIHVEGTKGHRGVIKPRQVPIPPAIRVELGEWCRDRIGLLFPFWNGDNSPKELTRATGRLSVRFGKLFEYAGLPQYVELDLRHEATCRWVEMRGRHGGWAFTEIEICKIMGWKDTKMFLRYASLRGEDLAARMV